MPNSRSFGGMNLAKIRNFCGQKTTISSHGVAIPLPERPPTFSPSLHRRIARFSHPFFQKTKLFPETGGEKTHYYASERRISCRGGLVAPSGGGAGTVKGGGFKGNKSGRSVCKNLAISCCRRHEKLADFPPRDDESAVGDR